MINNISSSENILFERHLDDFYNSNIIFLKDWRLRVHNGHMHNRAHCTVLKNIEGYHFFSIFKINFLGKNLVNVSVEIHFQLSQKYKM